MRVQEFVVERIRSAKVGAFRAAKGIPTERLEWRPLGVGQSVLSMARELAMTPDWAYWVLTDAKPDEREGAGTQDWRTVDDCERACERKLVRLFDLYRNLTEGRLRETKWLPFNGGRDHTILELLDYPRWNLAYHHGQIDSISSIAEPSSPPKKSLLHFYRSSAILRDEVLHRLPEEPMRIQDYLIETTRESQQEAFRYAKAVPKDKQDWKPLDEGRSVLALAQEMGQCADWAHDLVERGAMDFSEESQAAGQAERAGWTTVEACEKACEEKLGRYFKLLSAFPDERLGEKLDLPFGPGGSMKTFTMAELMDYPRWNFTYHLGQIAYVQTLFGDKEMH